MVETKTKDISEEADPIFAKASAQKFAPWNSEII